MSIIILLLISLPLSSIVDATRVTYINIGGRIFLETGPQNYAMFGQVKNEDGEQLLVAINGMSRNSLTSYCRNGVKSIKDIGQDLLMGYAQVKENYLRDVQENPRTATSYSWSDEFSADETKQTSISQLGENTSAFQSEFFPAELARVIIDGDLIIFIHYDGHIVMKWMKCLFINESLLIEGIKKMSRARFSNPARVLKKFLSMNSIDESDFQREQNFIRTLSKKELEESKALDQNILRFMQFQRDRFRDVQWDRRLR